MLALLQRDGRLIDFLMEDLATYSDEQVGAGSATCIAGAVRPSTNAPRSRRSSTRPRAAHRCRSGADPARVKVVGNAAGSPPFRGVLQHRGWEATRLDLPPLPATGRSIVAPAEVEVQ